MRRTAWARSVWAMGVGPASMSTVGPPGAWNSAAAPSPTLKMVSVGCRGGDGACGASSSTAATTSAVPVTSGGRRRGCRTKATRLTPCRRASASSTPA